MTGTKTITDSDHVLRLHEVCDKVIILNIFSRN